MKRVLFILVSLAWVIPMLADFDPTPPPEPLTKYKVTVTATPKGYTSGGGTYLGGTEVTISTSAASNYTFSHWTLNGEFYSNEQSFTYTVEPKTARFVAVYEFTPADPAEPVTSNEYRLYLENNIPQACSFNRSSGGKVEADQYVTITAYKSESYDFLGWYDNGTLVSTNMSFNYQMPYRTHTLTARFVYNPKDPDEPGSSTDEEDIQNQKRGDVNGDGEVNITDAIEIYNMILQVQTHMMQIGYSDANKDGDINISDAIEIYNWILQGKNL